MIKINRIEEVLIEQGKANKDLIDYFKINESTVSRWVNNKQQPTVNTLYEIAKFLKVDIRELLHPTEWN